MLGSSPSCRMETEWSQWLTLYCSLVLVVLFPSALSDCWGQLGDAWNTRLDQWCRCWSGLGSTQVVMAGQCDTLQASETSASSASVPLYLAVGRRCQLLLYGQLRLGDLVILFCIEQSGTTGNCGLLEGWRGCSLRGWSVWNPSLRAPWPLGFCICSLVLNYFREGHLVLYV